MATKPQIEFVYGMGDNLLQLPPRPIVARRDPSANDQGQIGQLWVNTLTNTVWALTSITSGASVWTTTPAAGATIVASLQVTGAGGIDVDTGDVDINLGNLILGAGNATIAGDLSVAGTTTITGDLDLTSAALIDLTSTLNAAPSIYLHANGGVAEQIRIHADQGTSVNSVELDSDLGGITLISGLASADAINLTASAGGIDWDSALQSNIASAQAAAADSVRIVASAADGGIDIDAGTGGITIDSTGAVSIQGGAASDFSVGGAGIDLSLVSAAGRVVVNGEEAAADAVRVLSAAGGLDANVALQMNLDSSQAAADAVRVVASNAAGGIDIDCGTAGIAIDSTGAFSIDGAAASNVTTTGAGIDLTLASVLGSVLVSSTEDAALAIRLHANGGTSETIQIHSDQGTGVGSVNLLSDVGGITLTSTGLASADAINLEAVAGGIDVDAALQINIASSQNAADAIRIISSAGGIDIDAVGAAGEDISIVNTGGSVSVQATEAAADAIVLNASNAAGGIDLLTGGGEISISSAGNVTMVAATDTQASPSATAVINAHVGAATFTGFTTAGGGTNEVFTITNSVVTATSQVLISAANEGANDAQMTITRVERGAGSLTITFVNNGAAALNGDVTITFWILN